MGSGVVGSSFLPSIPFDPPATQHFVFVVEAPAPSLPLRATLKLAAGEEECYHGREREGVRAV